MTTCGESTPTGTEPKELMMWMMMMTTLTAKAPIKMNLPSFLFFCVLLISNQQSYVNMTQNVIHAFKIAFQKKTYSIELFGSHRLQNGFVKAKLQRCSVKHLALICVASDQTIDFDGFLLPNTMTTSLCLFHTQPSFFLTQVRFISPISNSHSSISAQVVKITVDVFTYKRGEIQD